MAETSGPFDPADPENPQPSEVLTESAWELLTQHLLDGVVGVPGDTGLQASASGSTARGIDLTTGKALVRGHWYDNSSVKTLTSAANAASANRIDRAVLRLDRSANTVTAELLQGTAGAGTPALTDTATVTDRPLWRWTISPGATAASGITDERQWLGSLIRPCTSTNRPTGARTGQIIYEVDTGRYVGWTGAAWKSLGTEDSGDVAASLGVKWRSAGPNTARAVGSTVSVDLNVAFGQAVNEVMFQRNIDDLHVVTVGAAFRPSRYKFFLVSTGGSGETARLQVQTDGKITMFQASHDLNYGQILRATLTYLK